MRIVYRYQGSEKIFDQPLDEIVIGRSRGGVRVDIDLTPDLKVSRRHARISFADGAYWIEDLASANGTTVDGSPIAGKGKIRIEPGQPAAISDTTLIIEAAPAALSDPDETLMLPPARDPPADIVELLDATAPAFDAEHPPDLVQAPQLALLYELPLRFGRQTDLDGLLQTIVEQLVSVIPPASRGALLVTDADTGRLLLKAHVPAGEPSVSLTLARRAMAQQQAFVWRQGLDPSSSQIAHRIKSGMYAPLLWQDQTLGVVCVDNSDQGAAFAADDLRLMAAVAHYAAMAVAQQRMDAEARAHTALLDRLLTNFSPKLRRQLLARAKHGRLRLGGERSEVVILQSDIRGFTALSTAMEADDLLDLLNDYFSVLTEAIFLHDGTIDKFVGDAILAVFGSPEPDPRRHEHAIRAAMAMQQAMAEVSRRRRDRGLLACDIGIGIHCGPVLHGFIGSNECMELTVIGEPVNWTSRYCAAAGAGEILISPALHQHVWQLIDTEPAEVDTKSEGAIRAYRVRRLRAA
jgi:adenylate cyclase